ncbi:MAG: tryptophan 2,3-dioxygenase family protein [Planctomycetota bacterium]
MTARQPNYWEYIRVEELLSLQRGLAQDEGELTRDEVLFITVHQIYELWFKLMLGELGALRDLFAQNVVAEQALSDAVRGLKRITTILHRCVDHFQVMETLTTRDYLGFRDKLMPASGFQSAQLRQIEILLGLDDKERIPLGFEGSYLKALEAHDGSPSPALERVRKQITAGPPLAHAVDDWLFRTPICGCTWDDACAQEALETFIADYVRAQHAEVDASAEIARTRALTAEDVERLNARYAAEKQALLDFLHPGEDEGGARRQRIRAATLFLLTYRELPLLAWPREVLDAIIEMEQVFVIFRQRHARMVERVIGRRTGTGGSAGVDYLDKTATTYRIFRDLWAARTYQIRASATPPLSNAAFYDFRNG